MRGNDGILMDLALGAAAGVAAGWVMSRVTTYMAEHQSEAVHQREQQVMNGRYSYEVAVEKAAHALGREIPEERSKKLGSSLHWALGAGAGAAYAVLRRRLPGVDAAHGLAFGTAFFGLVDEGANTALGLTPPPNRFPWQSHARGLAGHLVFGLVADSLLAAADRIRA